MKNLAIVITTFLLLPHLTFAKDIPVVVVSVHDGDTLTAVGVENNQKYKVRLLGVDAPEVDFFKKTQGDVALVARNFLRQLAPEGSSLTIVTDDNDIDKHGRILGRLVRDGLDINKEMLTQGWGVLYFIYPFDKRIVSDYIKSTKEAYDNHRGIFSTTYEDTETPYLFRLKARNQIGKNPIGDFELKRILAPEEIENIPIWKRVFFPDYQMAYRNGYK